MDIPDAAVATTISAVTFIGVPALVYAAGGNYVYLQLAIGGFIARYLVARFLVPLYYEKEFYSPYEYMEDRLGPVVGRITEEVLKNLEESVDQAVAEVFKSFPVQADGHFLTVCRYVERNPLRAGLARRAEEWPWSGLALRYRDAARATELLCAWPVPPPEDWLTTVNEPQTRAEEEAVQRAIVRGNPFGADEWVLRTAGEFGLAATLRPRGRPRKSRRATEGC